MGIITKHLVISGRVQGVSYRAWMAQKAQANYIYGWVKNKHNGNVEAILHGKEENIRTLIKDAYEGPSMANVSEIVISDDVYEGTNIFEIYATD